MAVSQQRLSEILSGRYRACIWFMAGLSLGGGVAIGLLYAAPTAASLSPDAVTLCVLSGLFAGWAYVALRVVRSSTEANKLAELLSQPGFRMTFDRDRKCVVLEQVAKEDIGIGVAEAVRSRAEISLEEAQLIGVSMDPSRVRRLLGSGATATAEGAVHEVQPEPVPVTPTTAAQAV